MLILTHLPLPLLTPLPEPVLRARMTPWWEWAGLEGSWESPKLSFMAKAVFSSSSIYRTIAQTRNHRIKDKQGAWSGSVPFGLGFCWIAKENWDSADGVPVTSGSCMCFVPIVVSSRFRAASDAVHWPGCFSFVFSRFSGSASLHIKRPIPSFHWPRLDLICEGALSQSLEKETCVWELMSAVAEGGIGICVWLW